MIGATRSPAMIDLHHIIGRLEEILVDGNFESRKRQILELQDQLNRVICDPNEPYEQRLVLGKLVYDLEYYEPRLEYRGNATCFYGDEGLEDVLRECLARLQDFIR
jgi:hypothetical protein